MVTGCLRVAPTNKRQKCSQCQEPGGLFKCDFKRCEKKFHVRCAMSIGVIYNYLQMTEDYRTDGDLEGKNVFCLTHKQKMLIKTEKL